MSLPVEQEWNIGSRNLRPCCQVLAFRIECGSLAFSGDISLSQLSHSHPSINNAVVGYSALALSVLVGAVCMHFAGIYAGWFRRASGAKIAAIAMYVFLLVTALFYYSFSYVCSKFDACL